MKKSLITLSNAAFLALVPSPSVAWAQTMIEAPLPEVRPTAPSMADTKLVRIRLTPTWEHHGGTVLVDPRDPIGMRTQHRPRFKEAYVEVRFRNLIREISSPRKPNDPIPYLGKGLVLDCRGVFFEQDFESYFELWDFTIIILHYDEDGRVIREEALPR